MAVEWLNVCLAGVLIRNLERIYNFIYSVSIIDFEQVNINWERQQNKFKWCSFDSSQLMFTYSKLTIETLKHGVKYFQRFSKKYQSDIIDALPMFLLLTSNIFHTLL